MKPRAVVMKKACGCISANSRAPIMPRLSFVSGQLIETKSERRSRSSSSTFSPPRARHLLGGEIGIVGDHVHVQEALAEFGDAAADIAEPDDADGLALRLVADQRVAVDIALAPQRAVGLEDALRQRQQHAERMLGDRIGVAAGLIDHQHARRGAGVDIDGVEARAVAGDDQQVRRAPQQVLMDMEVLRQFVARGADLVGMRRGQDRRGDVIGAFVLQPVEPHVGPRPSGSRHRSRGRDI